ncbi:MAG: FecR family protein [Bacteroidales bacterium]|nr:FecR family protein [Bacteroidales bacterium]
MNDNNLHIDPRLDDSHFEDFFNKVEVPYNKSAEEVWEQLLKQPDDSKVAKRSQIFIRRWIYVAAMLLVLFGVLSVMKFYTMKIQSQKGEHLVYNLPDGSKVSLNAQSGFAYHPYWWRFSRKINFEGEAFFDVQKGGTFQVKSATGKSIVMGTSFNIFSRNGAYRVTCVTGKVKVVSPENKEVLLTPSYYADIQKDGAIRVAKFNSRIESADWMNNMFSFTAVPLVDVLKEVERQYNVKIETTIAPDLIYTGHFQGKREVEEVLALLCKPFGLKFVKISGREYRVN